MDTRLFLAATMAISLTAWAHTNPESSLAKMDAIAHPDQMDDEEEGDEDEVHPVEMGTLEKCGPILSALSTIEDLDLLYSCQEYFYHEHDEHFAKAIRIGLRIIEVDPQDHKQRVNMAYYLWSNWLRWKDFPEDIPQGESKADQALKLILDGRKIHGTHAKFNYFAGNFLLFARYQPKYPRPDLTPWMIECYVTANATLDISVGPKTRDKLIVTRRSMGSHYLREANYPLARYWYEQVLAIAPNDEKAKRKLEKIAELEKKPAPPITAP